MGSDRKEPDAGTRLVCSLGTAPYSEVSYTLDGRVCRTRFAPVAVAHLYGLAGGRATVLATRAAAEQWYPALAEELRAANVGPQVVEVPEGRRQDELLAILDRLVASIMPGERVVLDVTVGLRHLPFVYFAALTYLTAHRGVHLEQIVYAAFELDRAAPPLLDLTPLFALVQWYHALQTTRDSGDLRPVANMLRGDARQHYLLRGRPDRRLSQVKDRAEPLARALAAGLPVEIGIEAAALYAALTAPAEEEARAATSRLALEKLAEWVHPWAGPGGRDKSRYPLTREELARQLRLAEWYAGRGDVPRVLLLLREWLVSLVLLQRGDTARWLRYAERESIGRYLTAVGQREAVGLAAESERRLSRVWQSVANARNKYAHAGMTDERVPVPPLDRLVDDCRHLLEDDMAAALPAPALGPLLVTPLGLTPGLLYSAVKRTQPATALVITSSQGRARLDEALRAAGSELAPVVREMDDPHAGFREIRRLLDDEVRRLLIASRLVILNLTGGTTVMQYVVERIGAEAARLGVPVQRVALVDRRTPEEQRANPYVLGDLVRLEDEPLPADDGS